MEHCPSLRSLEAVAGRPSGTGRPTSTSDSERAAPFERALERREARRAEVQERRAARELGDRAGADRSEARPEPDPEPRALAGRERAAVEPGDAIEPATSGAERAPTADTGAAEPRAAHGEGDSRVAAVAKLALAPLAERPSGETPAPEGGALSSTDAARATATAPLERALVTAHAAPAAPAAMELPLALADETGDALATALRTERDPAALAGVAEETRGRPSADGAAADAPGQPVQRFELAVRAEAARAAAPPRSEPAPTPAERHAADILRQLRLELAGDRHEARLQLEPADLGRIAVRLALERGKLRAEVRAESSDTLAVLQRHVPELRAMLEARGVTAESFDFQLGFQDGRQGGAQGGDERRGARSGASEPTSTFARAAREVRSLVRGVWGIDTYA